MHQPLVIRGGIRESGKPTARVLPGADRSSASPNGIATCALSFRYRRERTYLSAVGAWISDRTLCYLASGRPCVVQDTGAGRNLPSSAGLRFFSTLEEAADALCAVERDYAAAARAARALATEVFSTEVVLPALLRAAGA